MPGVPLGLEEGRSGGKRGLSTSGLRSAPLRHAATGHVSLSRKLGHDSGALLLNHRARSIS